MSLFVSPRMAAAAAACALGALAVAPSAFAADTMPVPGVDAIQTAKQFKTSPAAIVKRQLELAPIIKQLAPRANQPVVKPRLRLSTAAAAKADACFKTLGENAPAPDAQGNCPAGYKPKFNQGYTYGSATAGKYFYFGTVGNAPCGAASTFWDAVPPFATDELACEGTGGPNGRKFGWPAAFADFARAQIVRVDTDTNQTEDITPTDEQAPLFQYGTGVRGGGSKDGVVLLGTTTLTPAGAYRGIDMLAFDAETGKFLGEQLMPQFFNIRNGQVLDGELYFGVRLAGTGSGAGGGVIRWTGTKSDPFQFETVAQGLKSEPAYITLHDGHIVTAGWTSVRKNGVPETAMAEMYQGPAVPHDGGLTSATADAANWKTVFRMSDLDPDPVLARAINFGDITSYKGKLLFSTYMYPGYLTANAFTYYGKPADDIGRLNTFINAERGIHVMEMDNVGEADQKVRLLYGDAKLPVYNTTAKRWELKSNKLNQAPKFGPAGFGNRFNAYSWMWTQYKGSLYMSTFDATSIAHGTMKPLNPALMQVSEETLALLQPVADLNNRILGGGDVWRFDSLNQPAVPETLDGFGGRTYHGVRAWGAFPERNKLYAGMASWRNLKEGWKLNQLEG